MPKNEVDKTRRRFLATDVTGTAMALQVTHLEEEENKLMDANEILRVAKPEIISLQISPLRPKIHAKEMKTIRETISEQYLGLAFQTDSKFSVW